MEAHQNHLQQLASKVLRERWLLEGPAGQDQNQNQDPDQVQSQLEEDKARTRTLEESIRRLEQEVQEVSSLETGLVSQTTAHSAMMSTPDPAVEVKGRSRMELGGAKPSGQVIQDPAEVKVHKSLKVSKSREARGEIKKEPVGGHQRLGPAVTMVTTRRRPPWRSPVRMKHQQEQARSSWSSRMFQYTPPWKVLALSLDPENKKLSTEDCWPVWSPQSSQRSRDGSPPCVSATPPTGMDSSPRRWVLKPLSPLLQPSDLRTIVGSAPGLADRDSSSWENNETQIGLVEVRHDTVQDGNSSGDEWQPNSPGSSSGSQSGFYSFVEDPRSPEAELNEAWMVSPQRQAQLAVLKKEKGFKLQTYSSNKKPESLFSESNGDHQYIVDPNNGIKMIDEDEEKQLRKMIIHSQAPRRSQPEPQNQAEVLDPILSTDRLIEGFSLSFSPDLSRPEPPQTAAPGAVVKEQINFGAARQKFLQIEQDRLSRMLSPVRSPRIPLDLTPELGPNVYVSRKVKVYGAMEAGGNTTPIRPAGGDEMDLQRRVTVLRSDGSLSRESSVFEDSGHEELSVEVAGGYASDDSLLDHCRKSKVFPETPIEREIRLTQEREAELRKSRGLKHSSGQAEMVRIKTRRSLLSSTPDRTFEKNPLSFILHRKTQREEGPQQPEIQEPDGRAPPPQLGYKKEEAEPHSGEKPDSDSGTDEVFLSPCCPHRHPDESWFSQTNPTATLFTPKDSEGRKQTASSPPASLVSSTLHELELPQSWRKNLESTGLQSRGQGAPDFIEKEIEEALKREQELKELRESMKETNRPIFSPVPLVEQASRTAMRQFYPPLKTEKPASLSSSSPHLSVRLPSASLVTAKPWASSASPASSSPLAVRTVPRGLTEMLLMDFEEHRAKLKLEESAYAGIQPVDDINNEVVESTRVVRHKNQRALLWEAGQFANQDNQ
ncbi:mitotic interactor and substrate of PLK1 isoform X4 [Poecilia reticulata]|uniref:mitotic interactor and substrate of PLK1 isoform X4 n=1 Tax=Poecilia reticulata TaxID=8081 RepID=UPI0007EBBFAC|nr:PREDICTED: mitotic interactor and substrate of PLK1-like isoform X4 [Poecilia reticulata]